MSRLAGLMLLLAASVAWAQDAPAEKVEKTGEAPKKEQPAALTFTDDVDAAKERARGEDKPLLLLVTPDWYDSPLVEKLDKDVLATEGARKALAGFVLVRVKETADREVHVRHKLKDKGYPLAVVFSSDGGYLGSLSGLPTDGAKSWSERVAAIPERHTRMKTLRDQLASTPEDPDALFRLAQLHWEGHEPDRADALLVRYEEADRLNRAGHLAEARYLRLRIAATKAMAGRKFADVEPLCLKWLRRFADHERKPEVLLLQANARYLNGEHDEAKKVWTLLTKEHADTNAAERAKKALEKL